MLTLGDQHHQHKLQQVGHSGGEMAPAPTLILPCYLLHLFLTLIALLTYLLSKLQISVFSSMSVHNGPKSEVEISPRPNKIMSVPVLGCLASSPFEPLDQANLEVVCQDSTSL